MKKNIKKRIIISVMLVLLFIINIPNIILNGSIIAKVYNYFEAHYYMMKKYDMDYKIIGNTFEMTGGYRVNILAKNGITFNYNPGVNSDDYYRSYASDRIFKLMNMEDDVEGIANQIIYIYGHEDYPEGLSEIDLYEYIESIWIETIINESFTKETFNTLIQGLEKLEEMFKDISDITSKITYKDISMKIDQKEFLGMMKNKNYDKLWERIQSEIK